MSRVYQNRAAAPRSTAAARSPQRPRPMAPSTRGTGARGTARPSACPQPRKDPPEEPIRPNPTERTVQVGDGFQIFTPSNEKREQMRRQAEDEQRRYEAHVERTRLRGIHEVHRLGGNPLTEEEVRQRQAENYRREKFVRLEKMHENQQRQKSAEEKQLEERKQAARREALKNCERDRTTTETREQDRKVTMDRFLDRLSQKTNEMNLDESNQLEVLREMFPNVDDETLRSRLEIYDGNIDLIVQEFID